ncbi:ABC transporter substrate-binding protein [Echinimonas agarilytica]|uniref:Extracellular solute-binding protein n=1 Tax=Echinimonas agarilytica TaxID=1215918 RepID=A0AA41W6R3_9GAMM|nr:extracellular solute-binding protein [Echinimonas agarilytica]
MTTLKGITWNHTRGFVSAVASAQRFNELNPQTDVEWKKRTLQEFADKPLVDMVGDFDLLVIDNPWMGYVAEHDVLLPLDEYLPKEYLLDQQQNSVGKSCESYAYNNHQWALAIDAAAPVSAYRPDLLQKANEQVPQTFDQLIALGKKGLVCCPSIPLDVYGNFLNLLQAAKVDIFTNDFEVAPEKDCLLALERLKQLSDVVPSEFFELNPIRTMEVMSQTDEFAYAPYTYGYTNYSREGYSPKLVKFGDVIGIEASSPGATMLGGTGIAISAKSKNIEEAVEFVKYIASAHVQNTVFFTSGGQPGHRSAWTNEAHDQLCSSFFKDTLPTLDRAFVRPRYNGYLEFQDHVGDPIQEYLRVGGSAKSLLSKINQMYQESKTLQCK